LNAWGPVRYSVRSIRLAPTGYTPFGACQDPLPNASRDLNTTCYAILGILALKPRTAYELAAEMQHCFEYFWPRADARVYEDAARLAKAGLVSVLKERVGKRPRTTYTITAPGQRALEEWLARPSQPVSLEFEGLLKVYLARFGSRDQLLTTLDRTLLDAQDMLRVATFVRQVYLECQAPFQDEQMHIWAFIFDFLTDYMRLLQNWAERTRREVESWRDLSPAGKRERAMALFERKRPSDWLPEQKPPLMPGRWRRRAADIETSIASRPPGAEAKTDAAYSTGLPGSSPRR
jgi:DNA-binding PadR family transcriptional regulator